MLQAAESGEIREGTWFTRLKPFFDKKFGPHWRDKHRDFWDEFDETYRVSKKELEDIM